MIMPMVDIWKVRVSVLDWFVHMGVRMGLPPIPVGVMRMLVVCIVDV
jgi:hypothetical protein